VTEGYPGAGQVPEGVGGAGVPLGAGRYEGVTTTATGVRCSFEDWIKGRLGK
jgi:hypothetical protein